MGARFDNTFKVCAMSLRMFGGHPSTSFTVKWLILTSVAYLAFGSVFISFIYCSLNSNFTKACTNIALAVPFVIICFNHGVLIIYKETFKHLIEITEDDLKRAEALSEEDKNIVLEYTERGVKVSKVWYIVCVVGGAVFLFPPLGYTIYSAIIGNFTPVHMLDVTYPEHIEVIKDEISIYLVIYLLQSFYVWFASVVYTGFYSFGIILKLHACGQIELVIRRLGELFEGENVVTKRQIKDIVLHFQDIYRFVDEIQQTHKITYEICLKTAIISIPITCFGVIESHNNGSISFDLIAHVFGFLLQCYIPCFYCDLLLTKGEELRLAVYGCGWERLWEKSIRSTILLMLIRTVRPLSINAVFCRVSLHSFKDVCHQAYSIFTVMNAARK